MLNYAVDRLTALPNTWVYLDGTHSAWLNVGDITDRLLKAGVGEADGFFLNAPNYQWTPNLEQYGTWISSCIAYVTEVNPGDFASCGNQYWSGGPANDWIGVALDSLALIDAQTKVVGLNVSPPCDQQGKGPLRRQVAHSPWRGAAPRSTSSSFV